jgi:predicted PurR-regulated permease PerM
VTTFAFFARPLVLPVLMAWVASMALKPPVRWLREHHLPAPLGAFIVVGLVVGGLATGMFYLGKPAAKWIESSPQAIPQLKQKFEGLLRPFAGLKLMDNDTASANTNQPAAKPRTHGSAPAPAPTPATVTSNSTLAGVIFNWTGSALAGAAETTALLFLLLASGDLFMHKLVRIMPTLTDKKRAVEISHEIQESISRYLFSVGLINLVFGTLVGTALYLLHMPNPAMWGALAMVANFIPYFGPVLGMCAVALAGLLASDTIGGGLAPAIAYLILHLIEANMVTPYALGRRFTLNPVIIFIFLILCIWLWGIVGAFLAVPILVTLKVICDRVDLMAPLGEFLAS